MATWQLQEAKARLSKVLRAASSEGPQEITLRGEPVAVVVSRADYERLAGTPPGLVEFMQRSPLAGVNLRLDRDTSPTRPVKL